MLPGVAGARQAANRAADFACRTSANGCSLASSLSRTMSGCSPLCRKPSQDTQLYACPERCTRHWLKEEFTGPQHAIISAAGHRRLLTNGGIGKLSDASLQCFFGNVRPHEDCTLLARLVAAPKRRLAIKPSESQLVSRHPESYGFYGSADPNPLTAVLD